MSFITSATSTGSRPMSLVGPTCVRRPPTLWNSQFGRLEHGVISKTDYILSTFRSCTELSSSRRSKYARPTPSSVEQGVRHTLSTFPRLCLQVRLQYRTHIPLSVVSNIGHRVGILMGVFFLSKIGTVVLAHWHISTSHVGIEEDMTTDTRKMRANSWFVSFCLI